VTISPPANSQTTDAVAETSAQILGEAPAIALASIYQDTAHALGEALQNAVNTQQQSAMLAQAGTAQAVQLLLIGSIIDPTVDGDKTSAMPQVPAAMAAPDSTARTIERVIESVDKPGFDHARLWSEAVRDIIGTAAVVLRELQVVSQEANMAMIKQAAMAAALVSLIKAPDQLEQYQKILELIRGL
jgi:hypothetical protein